MPPGDGPAVPRTSSPHIPPLENSSLSFPIVCAGIVAQYRSQWQWPPQEINLGKSGIRPAFRSLETESSIVCIPDRHGDF